VFTACILPSWPMRPDVKRVNPSGQTRKLTGPVTYRHAHVAAYELLVPESSNHLVNIEWLEAGSAQRSMEGVGPCLRACWRAAIEEYRRRHRVEDEQDPSRSNERVRLAQERAI